jgi:hypothetical protein
MAISISNSRIKFRNVRIKSGGSSGGVTPPPQQTPTRILLQDGSGYIAPESGTGGSAFTLG